MSASTRRGAAEADADHSRLVQLGRLSRRRSFAAATGKLLFRPDGDDRRAASPRYSRPRRMLNHGGTIHGGAVMSFIDMALFAGGRCAGMEEGHYVTLDCSVQFIGRGPASDEPLDATGRAGQARPGGHVFLSGDVRAGRRADPQLHRHIQARPHPQRPGMTERDRSVARPTPRWSRPASSSPIRPRRAPWRRSIGSRRRPRTRTAAYSAGCSGTRSTTAAPASICGAGSGAASRC